MTSIKPAGSKITKPDYIELLRTSRDDYRLASDLIDEQIHTIKINLKLLQTINGKYQRRENDCILHDYKANVTLAYKISKLNTSIEEFTGKYFAQALKKRSESK